MTDNHNRGGVFSGLLVGAIGGAIAVVLMDPAKRDRIKRTMNDWLATGQQKLEDAKDQLEEKTNQGRKQLAGKLHQAGDKLSETNK